MGSDAAGAAPVQHDHPHRALHGSLANASRADSRSPTQIETAHIVTTTTATSTATTAPATRPSVRSTATRPRPTVAETAPAPRATTALRPNPRNALAPHVRRTATKSPTAATVIRGAPKRCGD